jgi:hypothetical protein
MNIELSDSIVIPCPLFKFELRRVQKCLMCEHYKGLVQITVDDKLVEGNEASDYQVICQKPITRRLQKILEE